MNLTRKSFFSQPIHSFRPSGFLLLFALIFGASTLAHSQTFPNFPGGAAESDSATPVRGVALADLQETGYSNTLYEFYGDSLGRLSYAYSLDGSNFTGNYEAVSAPGVYFNVDENSATYDSTVGAGAITVGSAIYVGYIQATTNQLTILKATHNASNSFLLDFQQVYQDPTTSGTATTSPGMAYNSATGDIYVLFGTNRNSSVPNEAYVVHCIGATVDGTHCNTSDANLNTPTQPGLAVFQGTLYQVQKVNGSGTTIFVGKLDSTGHHVSGGQISGSGATFRTVAGFSMLVWNNELIFTAMDRDNSNAVCVYATTDGTNWSGTTYTNRLTGATAGLALFNGGLTTAYKAHDSRFVTYALHSTP